MSAILISIKYLLNCITQLKDRCEMIFKNSIKYNNAVATKRFFDVLATTLVMQRRVEKTVVLRRAKVDIIDTCGTDAQILKNVNAFLECRKMKRQNFLKYHVRN